MFGLHVKNNEQWAVFGTDDSDTIVHVRLNDGNVAEAKALADIVFLHETETFSLPDPASIKPEDIPAVMAKAAKYRDESAAIVAAIDSGRLRTEKMEGGTEHWIKIEAQDGKD